MSVGWTGVCVCGAPPSRVRLPSPSAGAGRTTVAVGSGRAAIWTSFLPISLRAAAAAAWRILVWYAAASLVVFALALAVDWDGADVTVAQLRK